MLRYGGVEFWCFLLADLSVGVQTAARAPFCPSLQEFTGNQWEGVHSWRVRLRTKTSQVNRPEEDAFLTIPHQIAQKQRLHFFTNFATKTQKLGQATKLGKEKTQPRSIPFATKLFTPHFGCICDNSPPRLLKTHDLNFSPILLPSHKMPNHQIWLSPNTTKINSFYNQTFHTSFWMHLWQFRTKIAKKPRLHFFTNFATKAQKLGQAPKLG